MFGIYARNVIAGQGRYVPDHSIPEPKIPTVDLKVCEYDKTRKVLKLASEYIGMPLTFYVKAITLAWLCGLFLLTLLTLCLTKIIGTVNSKFIVL